MRIGGLDRTVDILEPITVDDPGGGQSVTWTKRTTLAANRTDVAGREIFRGGGTAAEFDRRYEIRNPGFALNSTMRLRDPAGAGPEFEIKHIAALERRGTGFELLVIAIDRTGSVAP
jgi:hypothetical protein